MNGINSLASFLLIIFGVLSGRECSENNTSNYFAASLGDQCLDNSTCSKNIRHSFCRNFLFDPRDNDDVLLSGVCECDHGYVTSRDGDRCLFGNVLIGDRCEEEQQCVGRDFNRSTCLPGSGICACKPGHIHSPDSRDCLNIINVLATEECKDNAQCQLGKPGKLSYCGVVKTSKQKTSGKDAQPEKKVCQCKSDAVDGTSGKYDNVCLKKAKRFKDPCKIQEQCTASLKNSICLNGKCQKR